jgi:DNA invertase Pin-like site-specific DNA recombinase
MTDIAGRWIRVSGDSQSEADQLPDIDIYCDDRAYAKGRVFEVHGKSAYKGAQDPDWLKVVRAIQDREITVIVCWMVDRLDRQNILHAIPMVLAVLDAGGKIEFSEQPECNLDANDPDISDKVKAFSDRIHAAHQESVIKSKRIIKAQRRLREKGSITGRPPWGFENICTVCQRPAVRPGCNGHIKTCQPTADGRKYIPLIFAKFANGETASAIAAWLTAEGVPTKKGNAWNEATLSTRLVKNPIYYGQRRNNGNLRTEALVSYDVWLAANKAVSSRSKPGRGTVSHDKALLSPVCGNPECDATGKHPSPMYKISSGRRLMTLNLLTGKREQRFNVERGKGRDWENPGPSGFYYRCTGSGPQRKGCGNMVLETELDEIVTAAMLEDEAEHVERVFIPGDNRSGEVGRLRQLAMEAYGNGDKVRFRELDAQADELAAIPGLAPHWEEQATGITRGAYFAGLDLDARREYIRQARVYAHKAADGLPVVSVEMRPWDETA